jgi:TolB-like protein/Tfp pilus assembly protein PilF/predicted Ser/Thr protein kinase
MGVVYKAEDLKLKRAVALKFLSPHIMDSPELKERFLIEAQAAAALSHPNICVIHEVGESEDRPYIAMEYVEGETLRDKIKKGPLEPGEAVGLVDQVAAGLGEAHGKGITHRDIKSANIMVTPKGRAKVMDFRLAKLRGGSSLTRTQTTLGTVAYMSPEQARGGELDPSTDIWSLGVVFYEMLTGELPIKGDHDQTVIHSIIHKAPKPPSKIRTDLPSGLDEIVLKSLVKNAGNRYQSMEEVRGDLAAVAEGLRPLKARLPRRLLGIRTAYIYSALALALALIIGLDVGGLRSRILGGAGRGERAIKLAVLPFENLTGDADQEYLNDGLTQEMITLLGGLHPQSLGVIARTSVMRYKKTDTPIDQIGRELGVDYVLEGSARREGSRVRVSADLIQVSDQTQLWGNVFEREMAGILALQNDVAQEVARALALKLLPSEQASLATSRPVNPEAHEAYLRGSFHWTKFTPADLDIAEKYFDLALEKDPSYAPAYAGRAWVWVARNQFGLVSPEEAGPKAKAAALRAIELDEDLATAHEALASIRSWTDWDWEGGRESWQKALKLNSNVASVHAFLSHFLMIMGQSEEALEHSQRAVVLDPFNPLIRSFHAMVLHFQRRYDEAIAAAREALHLQPDHPLANSALWYVLHMKGMEEETIKAAMDVFKVTYNDPRIEAAFNEGYTQRGYVKAMKSAAEALVSRLPETYSMPFDIASCYAMAKEKDKAIEWLEKGFEVRDPNLPYIKIIPFLDIVRDDPRFQDLLRKMRLPADTGQ